MRVLIVDDEPLAQAALAGILEKRDDVERFDSASDAIVALERLAAVSYDVVLLDIDMPEMSGTELVDRLRKQGHSLPSIIFVTAHDEYAIAAFEKQAVDYVLKPFSKERIWEALNRGLSEVRRREGRKIARSPASIAEDLSSIAAPHRNQSQGKNSFYQSRRSDRGSG
jgi:DNA-binding LytR/AlgR family response regulator